MITSIDNLAVALNKLSLTTGESSEQSNRQLETSVREGGGGGGDGMIMGAIKEEILAVVRSAVEGSITALTGGGMLGAAGQEFQQLAGGRGQAHQTAQQMTLQFAREAEAAGVDLPMEELERFHERSAAFAERQLRAERRTEQVSGILPEFAGGIADVSDWVYEGLLQLTGRDRQQRMLNDNARIHGE